MLLDLPEVPLPGLGRRASACSARSRRESLLAGLYDGLRLATIVICVGAANALANPKRLLRSVPPALYEIGTALVVAVTVLPQLAESVAPGARRAGAARRATTGRVGAAAPAAWCRCSRTRSSGRCALAAGMDARGYGRVGRRDRRRGAGVTGALMLAGLVGICVGVYALLDRTAPALARAADAGRRRAVARRRAAQRRPPGRSAPATGPTRGGWPELAGGRRPASSPAALAGGVARTSCRVAYPAARRVSPTVSAASLLGVAGRARRRPAAAAVRPRRRRAASPPPAGGGRVIELRGITLRLRRRARSCDGVDLTIDGGRAGARLRAAPASGKSTLLGRRQRAGAALHRRPPRRRRARSTGVEHPRPRRRASAPHVVGYVGQDPAAGFVTDTVEEELAYGMEQLGAAAGRRCAAGSRRPSTCSASPTCAPATCARCRAAQQQRVAIGSVLTMHPRVLVLDEPTSALDPTAAEEVLATLTRLVHDLGVTVLLAEHRLERVVPFADRIVPAARRRPGRGRASPAEVLADLAGRAAGRRARPARRLGPAAADGARRPPAGARPARPAGGPPPDAAGAGAGGRAARRAASTVVHGRDGRACARSTSRLRRRRGHRADGPQRLRQVDAAVGAAGQPAGAAPGTVAVGRRRPGRPRRRRGAARWSGWCRRPPPTCSTSRPSAEECAAADRRHAADVPRALLDRLVPGIPDDQPPARPVRGAAARAGAGRSCWPPRPPVLLLDEPTRGLDYAAKRGAGRRSCATWPPTGHAVLVATHDVEFVAQVADEVVVLAEGEVVSVRARYAGWSPSRRRSRRRSPRCSAPPWLRVDEVAARAGRRRDADRAVRAVAPRSVAGARPSPRVAGLMMLVWPLLRAGARRTTRVDPPFLFLALLPVVIAVVLAEVSEGGMDPRVLADARRADRGQRACCAASRAGTAGVELVFFLLILAGRVFGPGFGFVLGCTSLFASALLTAGRRARGCRSRCSSRRGSGMGAGLLPRRVTGRAEIAMLAAYGVVAAYAFGLLMNLSGWPFVLGIAVPGHDGLAVLRARRPAAGEPAPLRGLHAAHLDRQLGHRPRDHQRGRARGARPGGADHPAPGRAPGHGGRHRGARAARRDVVDGPGRPGQPSPGRPAGSGRPRGGVAAAVPVAGGHPQVAVGGERRRCASGRSRPTKKSVGLAWPAGRVDVDPPQPLAAQRRRARGGRRGRPARTGRRRRCARRPAGRCTRPRRRGPRPAASRSCAPGSIRLSSSKVSCAELRGPQPARGRRRPAPARCGGRSVQTGRARERVARRRARRRW